MLTTKQAESAQLTGDRYALSDGKVDGLALRVGGTCQARACKGDATCPAHARHEGRSARGDHGPVKTWTLLYYHGGQRRRINLGRFPALGVEQARKAAHDILARVRKGEDPEASKVRARETPTLAKAIDTYLDEIEGVKAPRTVVTYRQRLRKYVVPALGKRLVNAIAVADVRALHTKITKADAPVAANRVVETLRAFYTWARIQWPDHVTSNPAGFAGFSKNKEKGRTRTITPAERAALLAVLATGEAATVHADGYVSPSYANAIRLALVTGMRPIDIVTLRHENITRAVDAGRKIWIASWGASGDDDGSKKTGQRRVLNSAAIAIIEAQAKVTRGIGWVFPNAAGKQTTSNQLARTFRRVRELAGLPAEIGLYVAGRHTYVSEGVMAGIPLAVMGADVDNASAVQRYAHLQRAVSGVSEQVLAHLGGKAATK